MRTPTRPRPSSRRAFRFAALASLPVVALAAACSSSTTAATGSTTGSGPAGSTAGGGNGGAEAKPEKITIAYQAIPNGDLIVKHNGWLEAALPGVEIEWKLFSSGGSVNEAIVAESVDIGLAGSSPVSRGLSSDIAYEVPWIHDVIGTAEALAVKSDNGINGLADLKGKKIATPFASTAHFSLLAALKDAGITEGDVDIIDAEPEDIVAAWERGDIDGAYVWNPSLASLLDSGGKTIITSADLAKKGHTTYDLAVVTKDFASKYPETLKIWVQQQDKAVKLLQSTPAEAAKALAAELNISAEEAESQTKGLVFVDAKGQAGADYLGGGLAKNLFASAEFNKGLGKIEKVESEAFYTGAVKATYAEQVAKG